MTSALDKGWGSWKSGRIEGSCVNQKISSKCGGREWGQGIRKCCKCHLWMASNEFGFTLSGRRIPKVLFSEKIFLFCRAPFLRGEADVHEAGRLSGGPHCARADRHSGLDDIQGGTSHLRLGKVVLSRCPVILPILTNFYLPG